MSNERPPDAPTEANEWRRSCRRPSELPYFPPAISSITRSWSSGCRVVLVTNGYSYKAYPRADDGSFPTRPTAYLNLLDPRDTYPIDPETKGALEVLELMLPGSLS